MYILVHIHAHQKKKNYLNKMRTDWFLYHVHCLSSGWYANLLIQEKVRLEYELFLQVLIIYQNS